MQLGLGFGLGACPSSILKKKKRYQTIYCFLSKQPQIASAWTWSRGVLQKERGLESSSAETFLLSGRQEPRAAATLSGQEGRAGRGLDAGTSQGCLCQAGGSCCEATRGDAAAAPAPSAPAGKLRVRGTCCGAGRHWGAVSGS